MAPWKRRARTAASAVPTRAWVTITARRVDPAELLEQSAAASGLGVAESIAFDGESAAVELQLPSMVPHHDARDRLSLDELDRQRVARMLGTLRADATVQDLLLETHVGGEEHVDHVAVLAFGELVERILADRLRAGVRYVSD